MDINKKQLTAYAKQLLFILVCLLPTIIILYSIFIDGVPKGHDYNAHMLRLTSLSNEINNHQFPYVFDYWDQQGIGFSWQLFYPPFTNIYLFISTYFFGFTNEITQIKLTLLQIILINFACAFYAGKRQYNSNFAGLFCAGILVSSYYYMTLIFMRFALSELAAIGFVILLIRGLNSLVSDQKDKFLIPITAPLIILTSIPIAVATIFYSIIFLIFFYKKIINRYILTFLLKSLIITTLIASIYLLPLYYNNYGGYIFMSSQAVFSYDKFIGTSLPNLIYGSVFYPLSLGLIYNLESIRQTIVNWQKNKISFFILLILSLSCSTLFPWWLIPDKMTLFNIMQFPWRILSIIICFASLWLANIALEKKYLYCSVLILISLFMNPLNSDEITLLKNRPANKNLVYKDYLNNNMLTNIDSEFYKPINFNPFKVQNKDYTILNKTFNNGFPKYAIEIKQDKLISIPLIYYRSVTTDIDGEKQEAQYTDDGSLGIFLKKGLHTVQIGYDPTYSIYGLVLSSIGIILLIFSLIQDKKRRKLNR